MRAAYYEANGAADKVLKVAEVETPKPGPGEVRVKLATSGVNPSDVKTRAGTVRKIGEMLKDAKPLKMQEKVASAE